MKKVSKKEYKKEVMRIWDDAKKHKAGVIQVTLIVNPKYQGTTLQIDNIDVEDEGDAEKAPF